MRLAIATGTFHPESGGPPTYLHRLGTELVGRGHRVRLLTFGEPTDIVYSHPVTRVTRRLPIPLRLAMYTACLARLATWAEVVFACDYGLPASLLAPPLGRPLVLRIAGDYAWESAVRRGLIPRETSIDSFQLQPKRGRTAALAAMQRFYVRRADRVIVPSAYLGRMVDGWGVAPGRIRVIHNAVDLQRFELGSSREEARRAVGIPVEGRVILSIARLAPWKGVDHLIDAVGTLQSKHDVRLVHCGEGPEEEPLRARARGLGLEDRVSFRGRVPREEIPTYLRAADMFALYSGYEGLSHVTLEAMAAGVPVVTSDCGGSLELVTDGVNGRVVPRAEPRELAEALDDLLSDPGTAERLGEAGRAYARDRFGWARLVEQTVELFEEVREGG